MEAKRCSKCGEVKHLSEFGKQKDTRDGLRSNCKECRRLEGIEYRKSHPDYGKNYYLEHREERLVWQAEWRKEHPGYAQKYYADTRDKRIAHAKQYRIENREREIKRKRAFYAEHKDELCEQSRLAYSENPEHYRAIQAKWRLNNRESERERGRKYYAENAERCREQSRKYYAENREELNRKNREWQISNPERCCANAARYRARKYNADGYDYTTAELIKQKWEYYGDKCYICGKPAEAIDHVIPLAAGGTHWVANLKPICASCNSRKRDQWPVDINALRNCILAG